MAPVLFSNSKWNEYTIDDVEIEVLKTHEQDEQKEYHIRVKKGLKFYYTSVLFSHLKPTPSMPPVILDQNDLEYVKKYFTIKKITDVEKQKEAVGSISSYLKTFPQRPTIYLRTVCTSKKEDDRRVFVDEAFEVIEFLLDKRYDKLPEDTKEYLDLLKHEYKVNGACYDMHVTFSLPKLEEVFTMLDLNKKLITIVPDIMYAVNMLYKVHVDLNVPVVTVLGPHPAVTESGENWLFVDSSQAILYLFNELATEVDWSDETKCTLHAAENCSLEIFRNHMLESIGSFRSAKEFGLYHSMARLKLFYDTFREHCQFQRRRVFTPMRHLRFCDFNDKVKLPYIVKECGVKLILVNVNGWYVPAWKARALIMLKWVVMLFNREEDAELKKRMVDAISAKVPVIHWKEGVDLLDLILSSDPGLLEQEMNVGKRNADEVDFMLSDRNPLLLYKEPEIIASLDMIELTPKWHVRMALWQLRGEFKDDFEKGQKRVQDMLVEMKKTEKALFCKGRRSALEMAEKTNKILIRLLVTDKVLQLNVEMPKEKTDGLQEQLATIKDLTDQIKEKNEEYDGLAKVHSENLALIQDLQQRNALYEELRRTQKKEWLTEMMKLGLDNKQCSEGLRRGFEISGKQDKDREIEELKQKVKTLTERCESQERVMKSVLWMLAQASGEIPPPMKPPGGFNPGPSTR